LSGAVTAPGTSRGLFLEVLRSALQEVLSQALSPDWRVQIGSEEVAMPAPEAAASVGLLVTGTISGSAGLSLAKADAAMIARAFVGEPPQEAAEFGDEQREAIEELLRQVFALATTALEASFDQVWVQLDKAISVGAEGERVSFLVASDSRPTPLVLELKIGLELTNSFAAADSAPPVSAPSPAQLPEPPNCADLSVLAGVEVLITLRFGHRSLALNEIAKLTVGSVVELDESLADPVEILVGERVIGRGEIVSVDGCYGVRITETPGAATRSAGDLLVSGLPCR